MIKPIVAGGLGSDQTSDIQLALFHAGREAFSPKGWDDWNKIPEMLRVANDFASEGGIALIGHSWGAAAMVKLASMCRFDIDELVLIDPVEKFGPIVIPKNAKKVLWFRRSIGFDFSFTFRAAVPEGVTPIIVKGTHNSLPHDPQVIQEIVARSCEY